MQTVYRDSIEYGERLNIQRVIVEDTDQTSCPPSLMGWLFFWRMELGVPGGPMVD